jgi:hypothetical protein
MSKVHKIGGDAVEIRLANPGRDRAAVAGIVARYSRSAAAEAKQLVDAAPVALGAFPQRIAERLAAELQDAGASVELPGMESLDEFLALLDRCREQVRRDPSGYFRNPHLYPLLHKLYLRLCHGTVPDRA